MKQVDRDGVNAVEGIFIRELKWIFREQTIADWGIDAHVEVTNRDEPIGRLLALQIKSGKSFFRKRGDNFVFYGEGRHLRYWRNHSLPVAIILHDPDSGLTLWQRVDEELIKCGKNDRWSIEIPTNQVLNADAREGLEKGVSDITAFRRLRLTFDLPLIREFAAQKHIRFSIDEWVNKSLGFRDCSVYFNNPDKDGNPNHVIGAWWPTHSIGEYFANVWPWLSYNYIEDPPQCMGWDEVEGHEVQVELNEIGKGFLTLEDYYANGAQAIDPEIPDYPELQYDPEAEEFYAWLEEEERQKSNATGETSSS
ncbi:DUF4365 domain-containing protein [Nitrobacter winogradskyi]|uniref:Uncharacterized protein n=2 Tax=Nitrobacter winogradskyi TaxID=913 RepID=A0ACC6AJ43_NITWI|nr:DUF4365 domain-containing protein [Nitrobacter winogradskyi]MCP1999005.1 hypothetical protein [Nitrobacter winogradskyi]GEC16477.1 hypothetical protein NWI01_23690 [Nitrobacter winogradskyi]